MELGKNSIVEISRQPESFQIVKNQFGKFDKIIEKCMEKKYTKVIFLGCGTSYYIAASAHSYFSKYTNISSIFLASYEFFLNTETYVKENEEILIVPFTRVASTSETMNAVKKGLTFKNVTSLQITTDEFSETYSTYSLYIPDMFEKSIVMTSSYSTMLYTAMYLTQKVAGNENCLKELGKLPEITKNIIESFQKESKRMGEELSDKTLLVGLGSGHLYGLAGETSVKVKEMALIPTEVYYSFEYRHGPISIADENTVFVYFVSKDTADEDYKLIKELKALKSTVIALGKINDEIKEVCDYSFSTELCECSEAPAIIIPIQYFGCYMAIAKQLNPDSPRNLSKAIILD